MNTHLSIPRFIVILGLLLVLPGCFSAKEEDIQAFTRPDKADVTVDQYIIQPPDTVTVVSSKIPELEGGSSQIGQTQVVRPDGKISFENIGEISVAGKTPRQVAEIISQKLADMYKLAGDYPVDVRVSNRDPRTSSKMYYVVGMVREPGAQVFTGRETTLSAISKAVPNHLAWEEKIQIIRPSLDPSVPSRIFCLNFKDMAEHGRMEGNVLLQDGDIIYVPPTIFASIGLTVGEIVSPVLAGGSAARIVSGTGY